jgi:hypothetical protein
MASFSMGSWSTSKLKIKEIKMADKKQLLQSKEFEAALAEGSQKKKELVTSCKEANKAAFE